MGGRGIDDPVIHSFLERLAQRYRLERVILFGSRARGDELRGSDYDFIIVSPDFEGIPWIQRPVGIYEIWEHPPGVEPLCYTPAEFARKCQQLGIVAEALKEGIDLPVSAFWKKH